MKVGRESLIGEVGFAAIDFESAGTAAGETDVPVQVGIAVMEGGEILKKEFFRSYLGTDRDVTWAASRVHGIRTEDLVGAPSLLALWPEVERRLRGRVVVAHAAGTEKRFLRAFPMHGFRPWVDSLAVARAAYPGLESHRLGDLLETLELTDEVDGLCSGLAWHDALYDSVASLVLLRALVREGKLEGEALRVLESPDLRAYYSSRR